MSAFDLHAICLLFVAVTTAAEPDVISFNNFGVYLRPIQELEVVSETWSHTFVIDIRPLLTTPNSTRHSCDRTTGRAQAEREICHGLDALIRQVVSADNEMSSHVNATVSQITDLLTLTVPTESRDRRGLFNFGGRILSWAFGSMSNDDRLRINHKLTELENMTAITLNRFALSNQKLASFMHISNDRVDRLSKLLARDHQVLENVWVQAQKTQLLGRELSLLEVAVGQTFNRVIRYAETISALQAFHTALTMATHGHLTPDLLPYALIDSTLTAIRQEMTRSRNSLFLTRHQPAHIYATSDFAIWRSETKIFVSLTIPLSPFSRPMHLYDVIVTPVPVNAQHTSLLTGLPAAILYSPDEDLFLEFPTRPYLPTSTQLRLEQTTHLFRHRTDATCLTALLNGHTVGANKLCHTAFRPNSLTPSVLHIGATRLLLTNLSSYTFVCANGSVYPFKSVPLHVEIELECSCNFHSAVGIFLHKQLKCQHRQQALPTAVPINMAVVSKFYAEEQLDGLGVQSYLTTELPIKLPNFKLFRSNFTADMADLKQSSLNLDSLAQAVQNDSVLYESLSHKLLANIETNTLEFESSSLRLSSVQNILFMATSIATGIAFVLIYLLYSRLRALTVALAVATKLPGTLAYIVPPKALPEFLDNFATLPTTIANMPLYVPAVENKWNVLDMFLLLLISMVIVGWAWTYFQRTRVRNCGFDVYLELSHLDLRTQIKLTWLPLDSTMYYITAKEGISSISISGWFSPVLQFKWDSISIENNYTDAKFPLPNVIKVSWLQALCLHRILSTPYTSLLFLWERERICPIRMPDSPPTATLYPKLAAP